MELIEMQNKEILQTQQFLSQNILFLRQHLDWNIFSVLF